MDVHRLTRPPVRSAGLAPLRRVAHVCAALLGATLLAAAVDARADDERLLPRTVPPAYTQECAACHTAYAPALLPASSWQRVMGSLDRHYGTDASLDPALVAELSSWLQAHAGTGRRVREAPPDDRITRATWFVREHRRFDAAAWAHPAVKSASNCGACHTGADRGDFDDDRVRLPPGLRATPRDRGHD